MVVGSEEGKSCGTAFGSPLPKFSGINTYKYKRLVCSQFLRDLRRSHSRRQEWRREEPTETSNEESKICIISCYVRLNRIENIQGETEREDEVKERERELLRDRSSWRVHQKCQEDFLAVDILRESAGRLSRQSDLARMESQGSPPKDGSALCLSVRPKEIPAGASQHAHEVVLGRSLPHGPRDDVAGHEEEEHTCLTKRSLSLPLSFYRAVVISFTLRRGRAGPRWDRAMRPKHEPFFRSSRGKAGSSRMATPPRLLVLPACQCTNHSPFTLFSATLV